MDSTLLIIITGIVALAAGFGIAKMLEKNNVSNLVRNAKKLFKNCSTEFAARKKNFALLKNA